MNAFNLSQDRLQELYRRWGWVILLEMAILVLLAFDFLPQLRGYKPWPPEWRWVHSLGRNLPAIASMVLCGFTIIYCGWQSDRTRSRLHRGALLLLLLISTMLWQVTAIWVRDEDPGRNIALRTSMYWFEDFFHAAQAIDEPADAFTRYDYLRENHNLLRVATHPPGMIWIYRIFLEVGERGTPENWGAVLRPFFMNEESARSFDDSEMFALALASLLKLAAGPLTLLGLWLIISALHRPGDPPITGRSMALIGLVPAVTLFSITLDQLVMALSTLGTGLFLWAMRRGSHARWFAAAAAGVFFLHSMIAYQVVTTLFIVGVIYLFVRLRERGEPATPGIRPEEIIGILFTILIFLWILLTLFSGFNFFQELYQGISAHSEGAIHANRSRLAWLLWNPWDVFFFLGLAWLPFWLNPRTWKPAAGNPLIYALLLMWGIIIITDGIRGETARIVMFMYPLLAGALITRNRDLVKGEDYPVAAVLLALQTIIFVAVLNVM